MGRNKVKSTTTRQSPDELTPEDCIEIESAINSKIIALRKGFYGDPKDGEIKEWLRHLTKITKKIGPEGANLRPH